MKDKKIVKQAVLVLLSFIVISGLSLTGCSNKLDNQSSTEVAGANAEVALEPDTFEIIGEEIIPIEESDLPETTPDDETLQAEALDSEVEALMSQSASTSTTGYPRYIGYGLRASHTNGQEFKVTDTYSTRASYYSGYARIYVYFKEGGYIRKSYYIPRYRTLNLKFTDLIQYGVPDRISVHHYAYYRGWRYRGNAKHNVATKLDGFKVTVDEEAAFYEVGDMLYPVEEVKLSLEGNVINISPRTSASNSGINTSGLIRVDRDWPDGVVNYFFSDQYGDWVPHQKAIVKEAMEIWTNGTGIKFYEKDSSQRKSKLKILQASDSMDYAGKASVGKKRGVSKMYLTHKVINMTGGYSDRENALRVIAHEIGHVLGLKHEHQRSDRDNYVDVDDDKENEDNYEIKDGSNFKNIGPYNIESIMHYFGSEMTRLDGKEWDGTRRPNKGDFEAIREKYNLSYPGNVIDASGLGGAEFKWSSEGPIKGANCIKFLEPSDPNTWDDNYLCSKGYYGFQWEYAGKRSGGIELQVNEPSDPHTWNDNYLYYDSNSKYEFVWSHTGRPQGVIDCVNVTDTSEQSYWNNNYFCWKEMNHDIRWSSEGEIDGMHCVQWEEPSDDDGWSDNYLCTKESIGLQWSYEGPKAGMRNTRINEGSDPDGWSDNYLAVPHSSSYHFAWNSSGPLGGYDACVQINEGLDEHTWDDNFLCYNK